MQFTLFKFVIKIMNNNVVKFNDMKIRILYYASFVNNRKNHCLLIKKILIKKINEYFREIHN